jgi:biopolymer transport protein ExbD
MGWRLSRNGWIGLALLLAGIAGPLGWQWWFATRTWVPLDMPISLARGHIKSSEFGINLQGEYRIWIEVERKFDYEGVPCLLGLAFSECENKPSVVKAEWSVSDGAKEVANGNSEGRGGQGGDVTMGRNLGQFAAGESRHYLLNVDVLEDGSRLDAGHPRLKVQADSSPYREYESDWTNLVLLALVLASAGAAILFASLVGQARERMARSRVFLTTIGPQPRELFFEKQSQLEKLEEQPLANRPLQAWLGLFLFLGGLAGFAAIEGWLGARTWTPVDMPISLARGHVRTGQFKINMKSGYGVHIAMSDERRAPQDCYTYGVLRMRWSLYRNGVHVADWYDPSPYSRLGRFEADNGIYDLDLQVDSDTSCLDANRPRLVISTSKRDFEDYTTPLLWITGLCVPCGASLVILGWLAGFKKETLVAPSSLTGAASVGQYFPWAQTLPLKQPFSALPPFGLVALLVYLMPWLSMRLIEAWRFDLFHSRGIYVRAAQRIPRTGAEPCKQPIIIRIMAGKPGAIPKLYVDGGSVSWPDLAKAVQRKIGRGSESTVYVTADEWVPWGYALSAMDVVRGLGCRVNLLTSAPTKLRAP